MKKLFSIIATFVGVFTFTMNVNASDLTGNIEIESELGSDAFKLHEEYDSDNNINAINVTLNMNQEVLNKIMNLVPSKDSSLGVFDIGISPTFVDSNYVNGSQYNFKKANIFVDKGSSLSTVIGATNGVLDGSLKSALDNELNLATSVTTWIKAGQIPYNKNTNDENSWIRENELADGIKTNAEYVLEKLGKTDATIDDLSYGIDYRIQMYSNYDMYLIYYVDDSNYEIIKVNFDINNLIKADYSLVNNAVNNAKSKIATGLYTKESVNKLNGVINKIDYNLTNVDQVIVDGYVDSINTAIKSLVVKKADYKSVDDAILLVPSDLSIYTQASVDVLNEALKYDKNKMITEQSVVDGYATTILRAINSLELKTSYDAVVDLMAQAGDKVEVKEETTILVESSKFVADNVLGVASETNELENADYTVVDEAKKNVPSDLTIYTDESVSNLKSKLNYDATKKIDEQEIVNGYANDILNAIDALVLKGANYVVIDRVLEKVPDDLTIYTEESLNRLDNALKYDKNKLITEQDIVDNYALEIQDAIDNLVIKAADYSDVYDALTNVPEDLTIYTQESIDKLNIALNYDKNKNITEQSTVDSYALSILEAIDGLNIKLADYSIVEIAIAKIPNNLSIYTSESVKVLQDALEYDDSKTIIEQAVVDSYAMTIDNARKALVLKNADYTYVDALIAKKKTLNLTIYTNESITALDNAINKVVKGKLISEQDVVDGYAKDIEAAMFALVEKLADYSIVDNAISNIPENLSIYTDDSLEVLKDARENVIRGLTMTKQDIVIGFANAINDAILGLVEKTADYSSVYTAIDNIPINLSIYTDKSIITLNNIKSSVIWDLPISKQDIVIGFASAINDACKNLVKKPIVVADVFDTTEEVGHVALSVSDKEATEEVLLEALKDSQFNDIDNLSIFVDITLGEELVVKDAVKNSIQKVVDRNLKNATITHFFDITLNVVNNTSGRPIGNLKDLDEPLIFNMSLPKEYKSIKSGVTRKYYVIRYHDDKIDILDATLTNGGNTLVFKSSKFSTYALAYVDIGDSSADITTPDVEEKPPYTYDGITSSIALLGVSIIGFISGTAICLKRKKLNI